MTTIANQVFTNNQFQNNIKINGFDANELLALYGRAWDYVIRNNGTPYMKTVNLEKDPYKMGQKDYTPTRFVVLAKKHKKVPHAVSVIIKEHGQYKKETILSKRDKRAYEINSNKQEYKKRDYTFLPENSETKFVDGFLGTKLKYTETGEYMAIHRVPEYSPYNL